MAKISIKETLFEDGSLNLKVSKVEETKDVYSVKFNYFQKEFTLDNVSYEELMLVCGTIMKCATAIKEFEEKEV